LLKIERGEKKPLAAARRDGSAAAGRGRSKTKERRPIGRRSQLHEIGFGDLV
jgi:hypothetical protein